MKKTNLKVSILYSVIYQILLAVFPLITAPYISRVFGPTGQGVYSYTNSIASTIAVFGMLGVNNYGNRMIAMVQNDRKRRSIIFWNIWIWQLILTFATSIIYECFIVFICQKEYKFIGFINSLIIINSMLDINWFFFGMEQFKLTVSRNIIIKILSIISILLFVKSKDDVWIYALITGGNIVFSNVILWCFIPKYVDFVKPSSYEAKKHIIGLSNLFIPVIAITIYKKMDKIMLGNISTMIQSGYYENVEKVISIPLGICTAIGSVMLPRMSKIISNKDSKNKVAIYIRLSMELCNALSIAMCFGLIAIANDFVPLFFGNNFSDVGELIQVMSVTILFLSWANVIRTQWLIPKQYDQHYTTSVFLGAIINFLANLVFIKLYGAMGAVIGTVLAEFTVALYQTIIVRKELDISQYILDSGFYFVPGIIMFLIIKYFRVKNIQTWRTLVLEITIGIIVYMIISIPYFVIRHMEFVFGNDRCIKTWNKM